MLKLEDIIKVELLKIVFDFVHSNLPNELNNLFDLNRNKSGYVTHSVSNEGLFIPQFRTTNFGIKSIRYSAAVEWNTLVKNDKKINTFTKIGPFKKYLKNHYISLYNKENN